MADELPPPRIRRRHRHRRHLPRVEHHRGGRGSGHGVDRVLAVHVEDVRVEAHIVEVPDDGVVEAHGEGGVVGVDVAVDLGCYVLVGSLDSREWLVRGSAGRGLQERNSAPWW